MPLVYLLVFGSFPANTSPLLLYQVREFIINPSLPLLESLL
jgi:hypothetical protein